MSESDSVALAALLVSLVAFFTTLGQLLQQYLATADGYRRCQPSVMGFWAQRTKLRWRWREFRFETVFVIPRIRYGPLHGHVGKGPEVGRTGQCSLVDTPESLKASMTYAGWGSPDARKYYDSDELACWVPLLAQLHKQGKDVMRYFPQSADSFANDTTVPVCQLIQKSWDFMPLDVVRPMASSTVSDVAIMARRLGMIWKKFEPGTGEMRAEGNGHVFTSTLARSLGTILQYTYTSRDNSRNCYYIPVKEADKLGFGLVEFDHRLFGPDMAGDLDIGSVAGLKRTLPLLYSRNHGDVVLRHISKATQAGKEFIPGLNDLVPLCSALYSTEHASSFHDGSADQRWWNRVPAPNLYKRGVTCSREGYRVFTRRLRQHGSPSLQRREVARWLQDLETGQTVGQRVMLWEDETAWDDGLYSPDARGNQSSRTEAQKHVIQCHSEMTKFLQQSRVRYHTLVKEHILIATKPLVDVPTPGDVDDYLDPEITASMESYFDSLPELVTKIIKKHSGSYTLTSEEVEDAWFSMVFKAMCWQRSHVMIEGIPPLPSEYWNSKMPVYIG